jgi:ketosteroid isomerase-like protein
MSEAKYAAYEALGPFFEIIMKGLSGIVDGDHYFDTIAEDATFEFLYEFPRWPRIIRGRAELMTAYSGYGNSIRLRSADKLVVYHADKGRVVIIEYEVHGKVLGTGAPYDNRALRRNSWGASFHAAFRKTTNSVLVAAIR